LAQISGRLLINTLEKIQAGTMKLEKQPDESIMELLEM
jgi:methionyl-tRNA formyltransferase